MCRVDNILQWQLDNAKDVIGQAAGALARSASTLGDTGAAVRRAVPSADPTGSRPLYAKLELLLDLIFRRIYYSSSQSMQDYSLEAVLRLLKKKDKDMGP